MRGDLWDLSGVVKNIVAAATEFALNDPEVTAMDVRISHADRIVFVTLEYESWRSRKAFEPKVIEAVGGFRLTAVIVHDELRKVAAKARIHRHLNRGHAPASE